MVIGEGVSIGSAALAESFATALTRSTGPRWGFQTGMRHSFDEPDTAWACADDVTSVTASNKEATTAATARPPLRAQEGDLADMVSIQAQSSPLWQDRQRDNSRWPDYRRLHFAAFIFLGEDLAIRHGGPRFWGVA